MTKSKQSIGSVNWTEKNRFYLSQLGFLDNRHGRKRKDGESVSDFINRCVTIVLENSKGLAHHNADNEELRRAYFKMLISENNKQIEKLEENNRKLAALMRNEIEVKI